MLTAPARSLGTDFESALAAVAVAKPFLTALMPINNEQGGDIQLDQLLQAMEHQFGNQGHGPAYPMQRQPLSRG